MTTAGELKFLPPAVGGANSPIILKDFNVSLMSNLFLGKML